MMLTVCIVNDHIIVRKHLVHIVQQHYIDVKILEFENGLHLIQHFPKQQPSIVLMDISMPKMNGYDASQWLLQHHPFVPILVVSDITDRDAIYMMRYLGVKGFLAKAEAIQYLIIAMEEVMQQNIYYQIGSNFKITHARLSIKEQTIEKKLVLLTDKEKEILQLICTNKSIDAIAQTACISIRTYEKHKQNISEKLDIKTREGLMLYAIKSGLVAVSL